MIYFNPDFTAFFKELEKHNSKEWFDENRKRYEKNVKDPFKKFIGDLTARLQQLHPEEDLSDKWKIMRINRDIRFSADKSPYKTFVGATILPYDNDMSKPGMYIQANHEGILVYCGVHALEKDQLQSLREYIADNSEEFQRLINDPDFKKAFGEIEGEKNKRLPAELQSAAEKEPLIYNKDFYYTFSRKPEMLQNDQLIEEIVSTYKTARKLDNFLLEGMTKGSRQ